MKTPDYTHYRRSTWVVGAVLLTVAVSGYFMGLQQTNSALKRAGERALEVTPATDARGEALYGDVPIAVAYKEQNWLREGSNKGWSNNLANLASQREVRAATNMTEHDRALARSLRASRRAYDGAPPTVPHPIVQDSSTVCVACHAQGLAVKEASAPKWSHPYFANCTQCHVSSADFPTDGTSTALSEPLTSNLFVGILPPRAGSRAWPGAPPTIPHSTHMRGDCLSCHGPHAAFGLMTSHPERVSCTQCHAPNAALDQYEILAVRTFP